MADRAGSEPEEPSSGRYVAIVLIAICVSVELVLQLADLSIVPVPRLRALAFEYGAFWPGLLRDWRPNYVIQPWTMFVTYGFLHAGLMHLSFNMLTLWQLGGVIIVRIGGIGFLALYMVSMVFGALAFGLTTTNGQPMVGASGALFGLAGALVAWAWVSRPDTRASLRATWKALSFLLLINVVMYLAFAGRIAWETHLGGFIAGWISGLVLLRRGAR
ncbi:rhomboid family intramembrane serine protease [Tropicimonas sp.]|uniref:rhomboid family intramembrane serine protease n=1 Tax=Tropicimonas sp. TaxID=2067044 RepID=UPI003A8854E0